MAKTLEFFFDFGSPASYLAWTQVPKLAAECGAALVWKPMLLGGVFKATGNASPVSVPAKGRWMLGDLQRWARHWGVGLNFSPHFPVNTLTLMRGAVGYQRLGDDAQLERYLRAVFEGIWLEQRNLGDASALAALLAGRGFDAESFAAMVAEPEVKAALIANTEEAVSRGVFGAPAMFVGEQLFFGQDRLHFVREALAG